MVQIQGEFRNSLKEEDCFDMFPILIHYMGDGSQIYLFDQAIDYLNMITHFFDNYQGF